MLSMCCLYNITPPGPHGPLRTPRPPVSLGPTGPLETPQLNSLHLGCDPPLCSANARLSMCCLCNITPPGPHGPLRTPGPPVSLGPPGPPETPQSNSLHLGCDPPQCSANARLSMCRLCNIRSENALSPHFKRGMCF